MQRFKFLLTSDFKALEELLGERIRGWLKSWVFTTDFQLKVQDFTLEDCAAWDAPVLSIVGQPDAKIYCIESGFSWGRFIFDSHLNDCPQDEIMDAVEQTVKRSFWSDIFNVEYSGEGIKPPSLKTSFKSTIKVILSVPGAGIVELIAPAGILHGLLNKSAPKKEKTELNTRFEAIANMNIAVSVYLDFGKISFPDLVKLNIGNPIQSTIDVGNNFYLKINNAPLCHVALGKVKTVKSIMVKEIYK